MPKSQDSLLEMKKADGFNTSFDGEAADLFGARRLALPLEEHGEHVDDLAHHRLVELVQLLVVPVNEGDDVLLQLEQRGVPLLGAAVELDEVPLDGTVFAPGLDDEVVIVLVPELEPDELLVAESKSEVHAHLALLPTAASLPGVVVEVIDLAIEAACLEYVAHELKSGQNDLNCFDEVF